MLLKVSQRGHTCGGLCWRSSLAALNFVALLFERFNLEI